MCCNTDQTIAVGTTIQAVHITDLRIALQQADTAAKPAPSYTDPILSTGTTMKAAHVDELRAAVIAIE